MRKIDFIFYFEVKMRMQTTQSETIIYRVRYMVECSSLGPTRPATPIVWFWKKTRPELEVKNPSLDGKEITSKLSSMWRALSGEEKEPFVKMHLRDTERYEAEKNFSDEPTYKIKIEEVSRTVNRRVSALESLDFSEKTCNKNYDYTAIQILYDTFPPSSPEELMAINRQGKKRAVEFLFEEDI